MCICVALWSIITTTIRYVYMCCHYNNNNKACVYVLPCGAL